MSIEEQAKIKAKELVDEFIDYANDIDGACSEYRIECALIVCKVKLEGEYAWSWNYRLYTLITKEIEQFKNQIAIY